MPGPWPFGNSRLPFRLRGIAGSLHGVRSRLLQNSALLMLPALTA
jgi:hypothetical protein